jgi:hypothetical protein
LVFVALDHPLPLANQMVSANHTQSPMASPSLADAMLVLYSDSTRYGGGISWEKTPYSLASPL